MTEQRNAVIVDYAARVVSDAIDGKIFAAGVTQDVTDAAPAVVPIEDDFSEMGFPGVTVALGPWEHIAQPGNERFHRDLLCAVWRERNPLGQNVADLYDDLDAIQDAVIAHTKLYDCPRVQEAKVISGQGIVPRKVGDPGRLLLSAPFVIRVWTNRPVTYQPA